MSDNGRPVGLSVDRRPEASGYTPGEDIHESLRVVRDFIERAREHHARTGEWPPDPLLDEMDEMRRRVQAAHGDDPWELLKWYNQAGTRQIDHGASASTAAPAEPPIKVSR
jgi:hypothetical protein